jgi:hypothetical protein
MRRAFGRAAVAALVSGWLVPSLPTQQPIVRTILNNGTTQSRYDMVVLGDGYQAHEQPRFDQDVNTFLTALFQKQPYQTFASYYNVHTVFRASAESGADHPDANPPIYRNTVYDCSYNIGGTARCLYVQNASQALADAALAPANEGRILVMVNDSRYGGCASTFAVSYNGTSMAEVQIHELGHSLGDLADEYDYAGQTYTGGEPGEANVTISPTGQKWSIWHGTEGVSAFEGARYCQWGIWRPKSNCLMRSLGIPLCPICREGISKVTNAVVDTIDQFAPATSSLLVTVPNQQTFSITHFVPAANNPLVTWTIDGNVVNGANGTSFVLDPTGMALGVHTVAARVQDRTALVRSDPLNLMRETQSWQVTIADPNAAQLRLPAFTANLIWVTPGAPLQLSTTIANDGPAAAGPFALEYFLARTQPYTAQDIYLGRQAVPGLGAGQQTVVQPQVQLPWRLETGIWFLHAVVDRENVVLETNENDNFRVVSLIGQTGACVTKLEYDDPLLYPGDAAHVSLANGGTVHPTVVARCAAPGSLYLIVWGCSGTSPGTPLAPGVTVPINQDFCTGLGLAAANGPVFQQFFGVLDAQGLGRAAFALPAGSGLAVTPGHFAAVLVDPAGTFAAATNAVAILLQ